MKYPEELIARALDENAKGSALTWGEIERMAAYAKWAHDQLRPRSVKDEPPPKSGWVLACKSNLHVWVNRLVDAEDLEEETHWLPMPPPPHESDPFEGWWETREKVYGDADMRYVGSYGLTHQSAKAIWQAALASRKEGE